MKQDFITIQIELDDPKAVYTVGEEIRGKVHIETMQNIDYEWFNVNIEGNWRGKFTTKRQTKNDQQIAVNQTWQAGQKYTYDFYILAPETFSFQGHNLKIAWMVMAEIQLTEPQRKELGIKKGWFKNKAETVKYKQPVTIMRGNLAYDIHTQKKELAASEGGICLILFMLPFLAVGFITYQQHLAVFLIVGILFSSIALFMIIKTILTLTFYRGMAISAKMSTSGDEMEVTFHVYGRENRLKNCTVGYSIIELVEDNRGTSTTTVRKTLFDYVHPKKPHFQMRNAVATFPLPTEDFPPSGVHDGQGFEWKIWVKKKALGFIPLRSGVVLKMKMKDK